MTKNKTISEKTLGELLPNTLVNTPCITIEKGKMVWEVTDMLVEYLESSTDSVVVRDGKEMIGVIGGNEIMKNILRNPSHDFFYATKVEEIMEKNPVQISTQTQYDDLISMWKKRGRAFAIIKSHDDQYFAISARKILEVAMKSETDLTLQDFPEKPIIYYKSDDSLGMIINSMLQHKTRRILLENSGKYINDRIIIEEIAGKMNYLTKIDYFLNFPVNTIEPEEAKKIHENLKLNEISTIMHDMQHPALIHNARIITPWDICTMLMSKDIFV